MDLRLDQDEWRAPIEVLDDQPSIRFESGNHVSERILAFR
jgi:hypothetical protein